MKKETPIIENTKTKKLKLLRKCEEYWEMNPFNVNENSKEEEINDALNFILSQYNFFDSYADEIENILE